MTTYVLYADQPMSFGESVTSVLALTIRLQVLGGASRPGVRP